MRSAHRTKMGRAAAVGVIALGMGLLPAAAMAQEGQPNQGQENHGQENQGQPNHGQMNEGQQQGVPENQGNQAPPGQPQQTMQTSAQLTNATLKVAKIDKADRLITFDDPRGGTFQVKAGPEVNLDKLHAGQMLDVSYYQEMAVAVTKKGQTPPAMTQTVTNRGGVTARQSTITAQIVSVDRENNTVRVKGPNGTMHTIEVTDPNVQKQLGNIQPGDNVTISYTQAVAVAAQPHQT